MVDLKELRKIESGISRHLFIICSIVTVATMTVLTVDFFSRGQFMPARINFFYLAIVAIYALHKELLRWLGEKGTRRNGEYFVYSWIILTTVLYVINFFYYDYFSYSAEGFKVGTLRDISLLTI
jgi:hypothetical protein